MWLTALLFYICVFDGTVSLADIRNHANWKFVNDENCGIALTDRIIGGDIASLGQFPWLALIGYASRSKKIKPEFRFKCGSALINKYYVLTAAHCVTDISETEYVEIIRLGENDLGTNTDCNGTVCAKPVQDIKPKLIVVHKDYDKPPFKNDLALIQLNKAAELNGWVTTVCLPNQIQLTQSYVGQMAEVAGFGIYDNKISQPSSHLLHITIPIQPLQQCVRAYQKYTIIGPEQICGGGIINKDSCAGDSGGPLTKVEAIDGPPRHFVIGIVSFGPKFCGGNVPAVYTRIASYIDWILSNIVQ